MEKTALQSSRLAQLRTSNYLWSSLPSKIFLCAFLFKEHILKPRATAENEEDLNGGKTYLHIQILVLQISLFRESCSCYFTLLLFVIYWLAHVAIANSRLHFQLHPSTIHTNIHQINKQLLTNRWEQQALSST